VIRFVAPRPGAYRATTIQDEAFLVDTVLYATRACGVDEAEIICNDDIGDGPLTSTIDVDAEPDSPIFFVVDQFQETEPWPVTLRIERIGD
jgi:hypothetical protein